MKIKSKQYAQALFELTKGKSESEIDVLVFKFVKNLKMNGDLKKSNEILKIFVDIYNRENGIVEANIKSARKLDNDQLQQIENFIFNKYSAKKVILIEEVNKNLLGGIYLKVDDEVTDFSLNGQLKKMRSCLSN